MIHAQHGTIGIHSCNISKNAASEFSGAILFDAYNRGIINYTTFEKNYAANSICIAHCYTSYTDYMCNIIENQQRYDLSGCIYIAIGDLTVENCTILGPISGPTFYASSDKDKVYVINCNIEEFITKNGKYSTNNIQKTKSLNFLSHLSSYKCENILNIQHIDDKHTYNSNFNSDCIYRLIDCIYLASE